MTNDSTAKHKNADSCLGLRTHKECFMPICQFRIALSITYLIWHLLWLAWPQWAELNLGAGFITAPKIEWRTANPNCPPQSSQHLIRSHFEHDTLSACCHLTQSSLSAHHTLWLSDSLQLAACQCRTMILNQRYFYVYICMSPREL